MWEEDEEQNTYSLGTIIESYQVRKRSGATSFLFEVYISQQEEWSSAGGGVVVGEEARQREYVPKDGLEERGGRQSYMDSNLQIHRLGGVSDFFLDHKCNCLT